MTKEMVTKERIGQNPSLFASVGLAGTSCVIAVNFTHPLETVKTRMQVSGGSIVTTFSGILRNEGALALWKGIQPAWGRESVYASIKIGGYGPVRDALGAGSKDSPFLLKFAAGCISGGVGAAAGNPFDVLKTLMQANKSESLKPTALAKRLYQEQGVSGFYRGVQVNVLRACNLNGTKMATYDMSKGLVQTYFGLERSDPRSVFLSSIIAGFFMTCTVAPFDMVRTQLMNQPIDKKLYNGFSDCVIKLYHKNGVSGFWRGFVPIWSRFAPMATLQLLLFEGLMTASGYQSL